jgi:hypothetical protein
MREIRMSGSVGGPVGELTGLSRARSAHGAPPRAPRLEFSICVYTSCPIWRTSWLASTSPETAKSPPRIAPLTGRTWGLERSPPPPNCCLVRPGSRRPLSCRCSQPPAWDH